MNINRLNTTDVTRAPSNEGARVINLLSKSGAEGQSRTDTESPHRFLSMVRVESYIAAIQKIRLGRLSVSLIIRFLTTGGEPLQ